MSAMLTLLPSFLAHVSWNEGPVSWLLVSLLSFSSSLPAPHPQCLLSFNANLGHSYCHSVALFIFRASVVTSLCAGGHAVWPGWQVTCCVSVLSPLGETPSSVGLCYIASVSLCAVLCLQLQRMDTYLLLTLDTHGLHTSKPDVFVRNPLYLLGVHQNMTSPEVLEWGESETQLSCP